VWDAQGPFATDGMDVGKTELKVESKSQLKQMAALLKQHGGTAGVYHRAHRQPGGRGCERGAVSAAGAGGGGRAGEGLRDRCEAAGARGAASFAPEASNESDEGQGRNRRVEMVMQ
jgi:hypothetical protein